MKEIAPSPDEWKELLESAIAFQKVGCWEWMYDSDIFGVRNSETGETGYCCVMGNLGELFALGVYLGREGLEGYLRMQSGIIGEGDPEILRYQKCIMVSFEDRKDLNARDLKIIKESGIKFRGSKVWPQFRSYRPNIFPGI